MVGLSQGLINHAYPIDRPMDHRSWHLAAFGGHLALGLGEGICAVFNDIAGGCSRRSNHRLFFAIGWALNGEEEIDHGCGFHWSGARSGDRFDRVNRALREAVRAIT